MAHPITEQAFQQHLKQHPEDMKRWTVKDVVLFALTHQPCQKDGTLHRYWDGKVLCQCGQVSLQDFCDSCGRRLESPYGHHSWCQRKSLSVLVD